MTAGFEPFFSITHNIMADITAIERARGFMDAASLSEDWIHRVSQNALLLEAHHTTHIEGTHLTIDESNRIWHGQIVENSNADDVRELLNYRDAFNLVAEYLDSGEPITEGLIREIHKCLVDGVRGGQGYPGAYRTVQNYIANSSTREIIYTPPQPVDVPSLMYELVEWLRNEHTIHPVLVAGIAQFQLVHIHPFMDGNGRTSRLLSTLCLYRSGYDFKRLFTISEFYDRDREAFYSAIQSVRNQGMNLTSWLTYFVHGLATQLEEVKMHGEIAVRSSLIARDHDLNTRQTALLDYILGNHSITIAIFENLFPQTARRTLQRDIKDMLEKGIIRETANNATDPNRAYECHEL